MNEMKSFFNTHLKDSDPELYGSLDHELTRQRDGIELIASENIVSKAVLEAQGAVLVDIEEENPDWVLFPFSVTRFAAENVAKKLGNISVFHQYWIRPSAISDKQIKNLEKSKNGGIILDDDYPNGIAKQIAHDLMLKTGKKVHVLAIEEKTAGFTSKVDNLPPNEDRIEKFIRDNA